MLLALIAFGVCAQNVEDGYTPVVLNGFGDPAMVYSAVLQADGKTLIGGDIAKVNGVACPYVCRLRVDGSIDPAFVKPNPDGVVHDILLQPDGKMLIAGEFDHVGSQVRRLVARLHADGSLDTSFVGPAISGAVYTRIEGVALQDDGKILVAGDFTLMDGQPRHVVARLQANGSFDPSFVDTEADHMGSVVRVQSDGKVLVGGNFSYVHGQVQPTVARLNPDGSLDTGFAASFLVGASEAMILLPDGKIMIGGYFHFYRGQPYNYLARLHADGTVDTSFPDLDVSWSVLSLAMRTDGKLLVGGAFTSIGGLARSRIALLDVDGSVDAGFKPDQLTGDSDAAVRALAPQSDGKVVVAGNFGNTSGPDGLARLNADGSVDRDMEPRGNDAGGGVTATALQADGRIVLSEYSVGFSPGPPRYYHIVRVHADGSPDASFVDPWPDEKVKAIAIQTDGKMLVSGSFDRIVGQSSGGMVRLNADGSRDPDFNYSGLGTPDNLVILPDGKILAWGMSIWAFDGQAAGPLVRLNADGSLDESFTIPYVDRFLGISYPDTFLVQPDGKIVIQGAFGSVGGEGRPGLARLNADGSLDTSFVPPDPTHINYRWVTLLSDGKLLCEYFPDGLIRLNTDGSVDTSFSTGTTANGNLSSYAVQADGNIVLAVGDDYQDWLIRLYPNGAPDLTFTPVVTDNRVMSLQLEPGGTLLLGGDFNEVDGHTHSHLARVALPEAGTQVLDVSDETVTWRRGGTAPELRSAPTLYYSAGGPYQVLGPMTRVAEGWQYLGAPLPLDSYYYFRVEARVQSVQDWNQGSGLIRQTRQAFNAEVLFRSGFD